MGSMWWDPWHTIYSSTMDPSWVRKLPFAAGPSPFASEISVSLDRRWDLSTKALKPLQRIPRVTSQHSRVLDVQTRRERWTNPYGMKDIFQVNGPDLPHSKWSSPNKQILWLMKIKRSGRRFSCWTSTFSGSVWSFSGFIVLNFGGKCRIRLINLTPDIQKVSTSIWSIGTVKPPLKDTRLRLVAHSSQENASDDRPLARDW